MAIRRLAVMHDSYDMSHWHLLKCSNPNHLASTIVIEQRDGFTQVRCHACAQQTPETEIEEPVW
jgi:hypothetical protein